MRVCVCVYGLLPDSNKDLIWFWFDLISCFCSFTQNNSLHTHTSRVRVVFHWLSVVYIQTCGNVANLSNSSMEQNSWRLTDDVIISRHIVNSTRLPSFLPGPKIYHRQCVSVSSLNPNPNDVWHHQTRETDKGMERDRQRERETDDNHRLRGSASPVLTATHHSYGSPKLSDSFSGLPLEVRPPNRFWRKMAQTTCIHARICLLQ